MASNLAEDLVCPICLGIFQEPHMLACGHNFCLSCVKSCIPKGWRKGNCPECRSPFSLKELRRQRVLANLAEKARQLKLDQGPSSLEAAPVGFCDEHEEPLKLFCRWDRIPICVICRDLPQHRGHKFLPTKNAVDYAQGKLRRCLKPLQKQLEEATEDKSYQEQEIEELENCTKDILNHISTEFEQLHQILHKKEEDMKNTVLKKKEKNLKKMQEALTFLKEDVSSLTKITTKIKTALDTSDHVGFLKDFRELMYRVQHHLKEEEGDDDDEDDGSSEEEDQESDEKQDESSEEADEEEEGSSDDEELVMVPMFRALKKFKESLDFEAWKELLESIECRVQDHVEEEKEEQDQESDEEQDDSS